MASSSIEDDDLLELPETPGTDEDAVLQFLEACRHVQTQAAALCANSSLPPRTREMLIDLRLRLLAARKVMLSPEAVDSPGKTTDSDEPLFRQPPPANPLAPSSKPPAR
jgi:hypothetical protein